MTLHRASLAAGTWRNREQQAARYITYMLDAGIPHLAPTPYALAQFIIRMHRVLPSFASVANAYSRVSACDREEGGGRPRPH